MSVQLAIFAPHVDDELIGCYSYLKEKKVSYVFYFYDVTKERKEEAFRAAKQFGFTPIFVDEAYNFAWLDKRITLLVPHIKDEHPHHKKVNRLAKGLPNKKIYYSVDMNIPKNVVSDPDEKRNWLFDLYPTQSRLFTQDDKYHLFEAHTDDDSFKMIWVTFQRKGFHYFPAAGNDVNFRDVEYLKEKHRHLFKFKISIEVFHNDREIEFHQFLNWLETLFDDIIDIDNQSCEMLADSLHLQIISKYPGRKVLIDVSEDGECGVTVQYD